MSGTRRTKAIALAVVFVAALAVLVAVWRTSAEQRSSADDLVGIGMDGIPVADRSFTLSGTVRGQLSPGVSRPVNLSIRNLISFRLSVRRLTVAVVSVDAPRADATHPCTKRDFAVRQPRLAHPIKVGPRRATNLGTLGVPGRLWPRIKMLNTRSNQDGCKGATLKLRYAGVAHRSRS